MQIKCVHKCVQKYSHVSVFSKTKQTTIAPSIKLGTFLYHEGYLEYICIKRKIS